MVRKKDKCGAAPVSVHCWQCCQAQHCAVLAAGSGAGSRSVAPRGPASCRGLLPLEGRWGQPHPVAAGGTGLREAVLYVRDPKALQNTIVSLHSRWKDRGDVGLNELQSINSSDPAGRKQVSAPQPLTRESISLAAAGL